MICSTISVHWNTVPSSTYTPISFVLVVKFAVQCLETSVYIYRDSRYLAVYQPTDLPAAFNRKINQKGLHKNSIRIHGLGSLRYKWT